MQTFNHEDISNLTKLHRYARLSVVITLFALLFSVFFGLMNDDYLFIRVFDLKYYGEDFLTQLNRAFAFYPSSHENQTAIALGYSQANWWTRTDIAHWFFRPLAALSHFLDFQLTPGQPALMHIHNYLYLVLSLFLLCKLLEEFNIADTHRMIIVSLFIVDSATLWSGWIAQRNAYIALAAMLGSLILYIRFLKDGSTMKYLAATLFFCLSLLSSEAGIVTSVFLFFIPLAFNRPLFTLPHVMRMIPYAVICLLFLAMYKYYHFGVANHPFYTDPLSEPVEAFLSLCKKFPFFMLSAAGIIPAESAYILDFVQPAFHATLLFFLSSLVITTGFLSWKRVSIQHRPLFNYGILCSLGALLPLTGSMIADRSGSYLKIGIAIAIGTLVFELAKSPRLTKKIRLFMHAIPAILLAKAVMILIAAIMMAVNLSKPDPLLAPLKRLADPPRHVIYITVHDVFLSTYLLEKIQHHYSPAVKTAHRLVAYNGDTILERLDANTITLTSASGVLLNRMDLSMDKATFHVGQTFPASIFDVEIIDATEGLPKKIKIHFTLPVTEFLFLAFDRDNGYQTVTLPPPGEKLLL